MTEDTSRFNILVVDNDPGVVTVISARLKALGYNCHTAASGGQALSLFAEVPFDLVISDLNMPNGNGVELAHEIRHRSEVPLILISGFKGEFRRELRGIQDVTFMHKPFETSVLVEMVEAALVGLSDQKMSKDRVA